MSGIKRWFSLPIYTPHHAREKEVTLKRTVIETIFLVIIALLLSVLIKSYLFQAFKIPTGSMENTLLPGDRIVVSKLYPEHYNLKRGDIVVFRDSQGWLGPRYNHKVSTFESVMSTIGLIPDGGEEHLVKRVIGLPGDTIVGKPGEPLKINGVSINESAYLKPGVTPNELSFKVKVPPGHIWVMGDNRSNSEDSRFHQSQPGKGFVPIKDVTGKAVVRIWPLNRISVFSDVNNFSQLKHSK